LTVGLSLFDVSGYVLAGGKSSRMGRDKALLELAGKPLVLRAVEKLRQVCAEVFILGKREELTAYAPVVPDLHEGCGPLSGIEAGLAHSANAWNLFMAVDMPFLPVFFLQAWIRSVLEKERARVAMFTVGERPQPALCLVHRDVAPFVTGAMERGEFKLFQVLMEATEGLAVLQRANQSEVFLNFPSSHAEAIFDNGDEGWTPTGIEEKTMHLWFANLNTPEDFAAAEALPECPG